MPDDESLFVGGHDAEDLLHLMERILIAERSNHPLFTTCTLLKLDQRAGTVTLHLVGHHEPLLTTADGTYEVTAAHGVALGIVPGRRSWPSTTVTLPAAGALTLYADGLTEGHSGANNDRLGAEGLLTLIQTLPPADPAVHVDQLIQETHRRNAGRHSDDLAASRTARSGWWLQRGVRSRRTSRWLCSRSSGSGSGSVILAL
ncbi:PP2C family protein-serine/threonine phosphatase [Streptomyces cyaneofuscatus]